MVIQNQIVKFGKSMVTFLKIILQLTLSLQPLSQATSSSYDHICETPFEMSLKLFNKKLS